MLYNYGTLKEDEDLSNYTGFTITPATKNGEETSEMMLSDYVNGEIQNQIVLDPDEDSIENEMASIYPPAPPLNPEEIPRDEDGEVDYDKIPITEDFTDKAVLVSENLQEQFEQNIEEHPFTNDDDFEDDDYDYQDVEEQKKAEAEAEERAAEHFERFANYMQDNGLL